MNIEKIQPTIALSIVCCIAPVLIISLSFFLLSRELFYSLNLSQFIGIAGGITVPVLIFNSFCVAQFSNKKVDKDDMPGSYGIGGMCACILLTICLLISYWQAYSLKTYFWMFFWVEIAFLILAIIVGSIENSPNKL